MRLTQEQIAAYHDRGFFILEGAMSSDQVAGLRAECDRYVETFEREMEAKGVKARSINHYKNRYFIPNRGHESPIISAFLFGELMADIARATLGDTAYLFNEQYVVKAPKVGSSFAWHQDSGYIGHYHRPYLSCWCALDDVTEENGTIYVLPFDRAGMSPDDLFDHDVKAGQQRQGRLPRRRSGRRRYRAGGERGGVHQPHLPLQQPKHLRPGPAQLPGAVFGRADHEEGWIGVVGAGGTAAEGRPAGGGRVGRASGRFGYQGIRAGRTQPELLY